MSALDRLAEIEARLNHEPCCEHVAPEYGNCFDCRNTGCAHAPYIDNEHARADMAALAAALRAVRRLITEAIEDAESVRADGQVTAEIKARADIVRRTLWALRDDSDRAITEALA